MLKYCSLFLLIISFLRTPTDVYAEKFNYGAKDALNDQNISLAKALTYAIEDEYLELARYKQALEKFNDISSFKQIHMEEKQQIQQLLPYFKKYNIDVPKNAAVKYISVPKSLEEAYKVGIEGERTNIAMYKKLASIEVFPKDILSIFKELQAISKNHLIELQKDQS